MTCDSVPAPVSLCPSNPGTHLEAFSHLFAKALLFQLGSVRLLRRLGWEVQGAGAVHGGGRLQGGEGRHCSGSTASDR